MPWVLHLFEKETKLSITNNNLIFLSSREPDDATRGFHYSLVLLFCQHEHLCCCSDVVIEGIQLPRCYVRCQRSEVIRLQHPLSAMCFYSSSWLPVYFHLSLCVAVLRFMFSTSRRKTISQSSEFEALYEATP